MTIYDKFGNVVAHVVYTHSGTCPMCDYRPAFAKLHYCETLLKEITWN